MGATRWLFTLVVCVVVFTFAACDGGRSREMTAVLDRAQQQNLDYDSITNVDSIALAAKFFDRHGTPNEQMRAYYLLGCAYRDMGEAPAALDLYHEAVERADTLSNDCNYALLCRVYSQMAIIFYKQNLLADNLSCLEQSIVYARKAGDTIATLNSYAQKVGAFDRLDMTDSVLIVCKNTYHGFSKIGNKQLASGYLSVAIKHLIRKGDLEEAKSCMDIYEAESGYFNSSGDIESGREIYYHIKGEYYFQKELYDSAEYYFRKELKHGHDFNNQNAGSRDLALLFSQINKCDSAAKYALYSYAMNDSVYAKMATREVEQVQALYNYSRHQRTALKEKERANVEQRKARLFLYLIIGIIIIGVSLIRKYKAKIAKERADYLKKVEELEEVQTDVFELRSQNVRLDTLLVRKELRMKNLKREIKQYERNNKQKRDSVEIRLASLPIYNRIHKMANQGSFLTDDDWQELDELVTKELPDFHSLILNKKYSLIDKEYRLCILFRLHIKPKPASNMLGVTPQYVTKLSEIVLRKLFKTDGKSKKLIELLQDY